MYDCLSLVVKFRLAVRVLWGGAFFFPFLLSLFSLFSLFFICRYV